MSRRVVVDTNVLVSALSSPGGNPDRIVAMISTGDIEAVYCQGILDEYSRVLCRPRFPFPVRLVDQALDIFLLFGTMVEPLHSTTPMIDESDRVFYNTAVAGSATLITGNLRHYPNEPFVVSPAVFVLRTQSQG